MMFVAALLLVTVTASQALQYHGYHGLLVGPLTSRQHVDVIESLLEEHDLTRQVLVLQDHYLSGSSIDLIVSPSRLPVVKNALQRSAIPFSVIDEDIQKTIDHSSQRNTRARDVHKRSERLARLLQCQSPVPEYYMQYNEMVKWMKDTVAVAVNRGVDVRMVKIGKSHEGRKIYLLEINADTDLPQTFLDAGIHAREWIAPASAVWVIHEILLGTSAEAIDMRENYAWFLSPCINPDGYEYTFGDDRFWRKNREPNEGSVCIGTDLNRNWDANWSACGVSRNPCKDTYSGATAFSSPETQVVSAAIKARADDLELYITIHAYSQLWLVPWGGSEDKPADYDDLMKVAEDVVAAIESVNGRVFKAGTVPDLLYCGAGGSFDWVKNGNPSYELTGTGVGIKYAYGPELRPASAQGGGFDIPPEEIPESGAEIFAGIVTAVKGVHG